MFMWDGGREERVRGGSSEEQHDAGRGSSRDHADDELDSEDL